MGATFPITHSHGWFWARTGHKKNLYDIWEAEVKQQSLTSESESRDLGAAASHVSSAGLFFCQEAAAGPAAT